MSRPHFDLILVGGGLQNGLIALAALHVDPKRAIVLIEAASTIGGNHTWCAHPNDVPESAKPWVDPLFDHRWRAYEVRFPSYRRELRGEYAAITSQRFGAAVRVALESSANSALFLGRTALTIDAHRVRLDDGHELSGDLVIDARGPQPHDRVSDCGFQKFLGLEIELERPHGLRSPILMDATVSQRDGFRFLYTLPFAGDRLLIEDTTFSRSAGLDDDEARAAVLAAARTWSPIRRVLREERGVLPMPWASSDIEPTSSPLLAGYRGGWFHPATGYSFPPAVRLACHISCRRGAEVVDTALARLYRAHRTQVEFAQHLNRMLFTCFSPGDAWNVFARFYRLPDDLIRRFYALEMTLADRVRLIAGRPPTGFSFRKAFEMVVDGVRERRQVTTTR